MPSDSFDKLNENNPQRKALFEASLKDDNIFAGEQKKEEEYTLEELISKCNLTIRNTGISDAEKVIEGTEEHGRRIKIVFGEKGTLIEGQVKLYLGGSSKPVEDIDTTKKALEKYRPVAKKESLKERITSIKNDLLKKFE